MLDFLYIAISWVLLRWHDLFSSFLDPGGGITWALSIFMLVVTIRILLFRFFIKQVHSQRKMQEVQPKIAALREKYKNDRQALSQEMMKLQKEEGFNPLSGCLPILLQAPVFLALFHVLRVAADTNGGGALIGYGWNWDQVGYALEAKLFGAPIAAAFGTSAERIAELGGTTTATRVVAFTLIVLMVAATYITQRQIIARNTQVLDSQQAMIQKLLLYGMPASLFVSGFLFPIGVLLYWFTNNLWTMGQQFYILKRMPHPNAAKDTRPSIDAKLLAPKPGQKPIRPDRRASTAPAVDGGTAIPAPDGPTGTPSAGKAQAAKAQPAKAPNGKAASTGKAAPIGKAAPTGKGTKAPGGKPATGQSDGPSPNGGVPTHGATAAGEPPAGDDTDGTGAGGPRAAPRPGGGAKPGGGRRPQGQRSPTQTRQKKKRR